MKPSSRKRKNILTDDERAGDLKGFVRIGMIDQQFWDFWRIDRDFDLGEAAEECPWPSDVQQQQQLKQQ